MNFLKFQKKIFNLKPFFPFVNKTPILSNQPCVVVNLTATIKDFPDPPVTKIIGYPEQNKLKQVSRQPKSAPGVPTSKMTRKPEHVRGPELIHNKLIHKQYGIVALSGGQLKYGHFEMIRQAINKKMDTKKAFAIWRVDPPWKPITRHGQGQKLGGGKGGIDHYVTPVKRGRVIIELGGYLSPYFMERTAMEVTQKLPFPAKLVSEKDLIEWENEDKYVKENNLNKLRWEWCIKNNVLNVLNYVGKYDIENCQYGPDCR